jgi:2-hydroxychromene-2-carboxylate isomerase
LTKELPSRSWQVAWGSAALNEAAIESTALPRVQGELVTQSMEAYETGICGVPGFVAHGEIFFGADRLDLLVWRLRERLWSAP